MLLLTLTTFRVVFLYYLLVFCKPGLLYFIATSGFHQTKGFFKTNCSLILITWGSFDNQSDIYN